MKEQKIHMSSEQLLAAAVANLRAAGLPEPLARTLAGRVTVIVEQLRRQAEALPPSTEPATLFTLEEGRKRP